MAGKRIVSVVVASCAGLLLASCSWFAELITPIEGTWQGNGVLSNGASTQSVSLTMTLTRQGRAGIVGSLTSATWAGSAFPGTLPIPFEGSIEGTDMDLGMTLTYSSYTYVFTTAGTVSGTSYSSSCTMIDSARGTYTGTFTATRVTNVAAE